MSYKQINKTEAREAINRVASTEDGQILLAVLCNECGFMSNLMSMDNPNKTQVLAAQRGVYARLRKVIRPEHLRKAEYDITIVEDEIKKKGEKDAIKKRLKS